jgi:hypothetical protein
LIDVEKDTLDELGGSGTLDQLKKDLFSYIEKNSSKIDNNLPIFYGFIISAIEKVDKDLSDTVYDEFIDEITFRLLEESENVRDSEFIEKVCTNAIRSKRKSTARIGIDVAAAIKLMKMGDFYRAIPLLNTYAKSDALITASLAYCYYMLSLKEIAKDLQPVPSRPSEMELFAREQMLYLAQNRPPFYILSHFQIKDEPWLTRAFWLMITTSLQWFPSEPGLLIVGIEKAKKDGNKEMRKELLKTANERFFSDMFFMRETYQLNLEEKDPIGAAGIVKQMIQMHPEALEPIYYGIKLSLLTSTRNTFTTFRTLAVNKGMPSTLLFLLDLAFATVSKDHQSITQLLQNGKKQFPELLYLINPLEYILQDVFSDDPKKIKRAKKTVIDAIELYTLQVLP